MKIGIYAEHTGRAGQLVLDELDSESDDIELWEGTRDGLAYYAREELARHPDASMAHRRRTARTILRFLTTGCED